MKAKRFLTIGLLVVWISLPAIVAQKASPSATEGTWEASALRRPCAGALRGVAKTAGERWKPGAFPFEKDGELYFLYEGPAKQVEFVGDLTRWKQAGLLFESVPGTSQKCLRLGLGLEARAEYKLIIDGDWHLDPMNNRRVDNGVGGENSVITMPGYKPTRWDSDLASPLSTGVSELTVESAKFGSRKIHVYIPTAYFKAGIAPRLPVLYLQDGTEYLERAKAVNILENLNAAGRVQPFMIVFVDPKDRMKEYWANDDWAHFLAKEVVPAVEGKYFTAVRKGRENRALLGASLGGITSIWAGLRYPEVFGRIGAQSASFWIDDERVVKAIAKLDRSKFDFTFYIDDGLYEGVEDSRKVVAILNKKGFDVTYTEKETGHNWTSWRDRLAGAFIGLWN